MAAFTLLATMLAAFALAEPNAREFKSYYEHLTSDSLMKFNTDNVTKTFTAPELDTCSAITYEHIDDLKARELTRRFDITRKECIPPLDIPVEEDCLALCEHIAGMQGPLLIDPLDIWYLETGGCVFGAASLDACTRISIDPMSELAEFCNAMYIECVWQDPQEGNEMRDGFIEGTDPNMAMALSGAKAAPPYSEEPC